MEFRPSIFWNVKQYKIKDYHYFYFVNNLNIVVAKKKKNGNIQKQFLKVKNNKISEHFMYRIVKLLTMINILCVRHKVCLYNTIIESNGNRRRELFSYVRKEKMNQ